MFAAKRKVLALILVIVAGFPALSTAEAAPMLGWPADGEASPGFAALLSLLPMPVAMGQFYVGDWTTGLAFTSLEIAEMVVAGAVFSYEGGAMMGRGVPIGDWDTTGQIVFFSALGGYLVTKIAAAVLAASTADTGNRKGTESTISLAIHDREVGVSIALDSVNP